MKWVDFQGLAGIVVDNKPGPQTYASLAKWLRSPRRSEVLGLRLTEHFSLGEMLKSATAEARGVANNPAALQLAAMVDLCANILEPVRRRWGAVRVTSGFRIFTPDSQHGKGEAADFEVTGIENLTVARWIVDNLVFDQLILEAWNPTDPNAGWIHCSFKRGRARRSILRTKTGRAPYFAGLPK